MPRKKQTTGSEVLRRLATGLRTAATRPNIHGYVPHEKQVDFHVSDAQIRLFLGGNRSGKTVGGAAESVWRLMGNHPYLITKRPPVHLRGVSVDFIDGLYKIMLPQVSRWLPPSSLINGSWEQSWDNYERVLTLENGSTMEFLSYEQDVEKHAGTSKDGIWMDEEPPKPIYDENLLRLLDTLGPLWLTMTPVEGMTWIYDTLYIAARTNPTIHVTEVDMAHNPHLNHGEIDQFLSTLDKDGKEARQHGKFVHLGGLIYKEFGERNIIDPVIPPKDWLHLTSMDHGLTNPTAWLWAAVGPDGEIIIYDEHYESQQLVGYHAQAVIVRENSRGIHPSYRVGDPHIVDRNAITGTSVQLEYMDYGIAIMPGNNDVPGGINRVKRYIEGVQGRPQLYVTRNCVNFINEASRYRWSTYANKKLDFSNNKKEEPHKKNDHLMDAARYLIASRPMLDTGTDIPDFDLAKRLGIPVAEDPAESYDGFVKHGELVIPTGLHQSYSGRTEWHDPVLGSEW